MVYFYIYILLLIYKYWSDGAIFKSSDALKRSLKNFSNNYNLFYFCIAPPTRREKNVDYNMSIECIKIVGTQLNKIIFKTNSKLWVTVLIY